MILFRLIGLLFDLLLLPLRLLRRVRAVAPGAFVTITVDGPVADIVPKPRFWELRRQHATSLHAVSELADLVIVDPRVRGLLVTLKSLSTGMAGATSLRAILARARAAGKEVVVHLPMGGGTKEVYVASAGSKVYLGPATQLAPLGFLHASRYLRRALDKAGLEPEVFACGEYKSAGENLVRDSMSDAQREQLGGLLDRLHAALVDGIAEGRGMTVDEARAVVDGAPYFGEAAVAARLADGLAYEDELPGLLGVTPPPKAGARRGIPLALGRRLVSGAAYLAMARRPLLRRLRARPLVAVIPVHGTITHAAGTFGGFSTDERIARMVRVARLHPRVRAAILHVDSPGGSALASDRMHHEIAQLAREKPVIACMANVAASGGYYVAAPAHRIVCEATTVTGSIGVVAARLGIEPLLAKLGVTTEVLKRGARAGLLSPAQPLTEDERAAVRRELDATYRAFLGVVAAGRKRTPEEIEPLARGRVYTGEAALAAGLVDALGGFDEAMREVRRMLPSEIRDRVVPRVVRLPRRPLPVLAPPAQGEAGRREVGRLLAALLPPGERSLLELGASGERSLTLWTEFAALRG